MSKRTNTAYDLSRFEPSREREPQRRPDIKRVARKKLVNYTNPVKIVAVLFCVITVTAIILYTRVQITEVNTDINGLTNEYREEKSEEVRLQMEIEQKMSLEQISEYVKTNFGMIEAGKMHIRPFTLSSENRIEIKKSSDFDLIRSIESFFSKVKEYIAS